MKTMMQTLGEMIGAKFAKITEIFAQKGQVSEAYDNLGKIERIVKGFNDSVFVGSEDKELDSLPKITAFLTENKDHIESPGITGTADEFTTAFEAAAGELFKTV